MREPVGRTQRRGAGSRKPREQRWAELFTVATEVFYQKGYESASLQDIADQLGMLKGSLYYYIHSKEDLLYEVINEVHRKGLANIESLADQPGEAVERLYRVVIGHIDHMCRDLKGTAVFLHELQALPPERQQEILGGEHAYRSVFRDLISQGQAEGTVRADVDPKLASLSILGSINWVYRWFRPGGEFTPKQIGEQFASMIVRSVATEAAIAQLSTPNEPPKRSSGKRAGTKKATNTKTA